MSGTLIICPKCYAERELKRSLMFYDPELNTSSQVPFQDGFEHIRHVLQTLISDELELCETHDYEQQQLHAARDRDTLHLKRKRAVEMFCTLFPTAENRRRIALTFLREEGDLPAEVWHSFLVTAADAEDADNLNREMNELRKRHFKRLGKPVPKYKGPPLR